MVLHQKSTRVVGMYGGSFNPLHNGHIHCIREALNQCNILHIIVGDLPNRDVVPYVEKQCWFQSIFRDEIATGRIVLHRLTDQTSDKQDYTIDKWLSDSALIKGMVGTHIDIVFCGEDYKCGAERDKSPYEVCYPDSEIVYLSRSTVPVSSTKIRANAVQYRRYIPAEVFVSLIKYSSSK